MSEKITRTYEVGFVLAPTIAEAELSGAVATLTAVITKEGGVVVKEQAPEFIDLAYTMEKTIASKKVKCSQGYFGWIKFDATPEAIEAIKKSFDAMVDLVRYIIIKTHVENAVVFRKPKIEAIRPLVDDESMIEDEEVVEDDLKEDHEMLPDVAADIEESAETKEEESEA